jgi:hypothetical protein
VGIAIRTSSAISTASARSSASPTALEWNVGPMDAGEAAAHARQPTLRSTSVSTAPAKTRPAFQTVSTRNADPMGAEASAASATDSRRPANPMESASRTIASPSAQARSVARTDAGECVVNAPRDRTALGSDNARRPRSPVRPTATKNNADPMGAGTIAASVQISSIVSTTSVFRTAVSRTALESNAEETDVADRAEHVPTVWIAERTESV